MNLLKNIVTGIILLVSLIAYPTLYSCKSSNSKDVITDEDTIAKKQLQGTWISEFDGDAMFTMKGDTIYYNDSTSAPVAFYVRHDSLIIRNHQEVRYLIKRLNSTQFHFINIDGDEIELVKSDNAAPLLSKGEHRGAINLIQGKKVKSDSILTIGDTKYHAYTQVSPTTYKVYHTSTNEDGLSIESVYYDNNVYIALYKGPTKLFGHDIRKEDFATFVPKGYLDQAVLSEISIQGTTTNGVRFIAVLAIPDSYTNYRINIDITTDGKKKLSV